MKRKIIISKVITFLVVTVLLSSVFNLEVSEASVIEYPNVYSTLSQSEKDELSTALFWLHRAGEFHYEDKYREDKIVFTAMEQAMADYYDKDIECHRSQREIADPLEAFQDYDKVESDGVDWYLTNVWNINPSHLSFTSDEESYYYENYYYKYYHNFPIMSEGKIKKLYDLGNNYYGVEYDVANDYDWDEFFGPYYAIFKKKEIDGKSIWSYIYNQNVKDSLSLETVLSNIEPPSPKYVYKEVTKEFSQEDIEAIVNAIAKDLGGEVVSIYKLSDGVYYVVIRLKDGSYGGAVAKQLRSENGQTFKTEGLSEVVMTQEELDAYVSQMNAKPNIIINYGETTGFEKGIDYTKYFKKVIEEMGGLPLNDMDKSEIATYIENGITITSKHSTEAKNNKITIEGKDMKNSVELAKNAITEFESILSDQKISLNKELKIIIRIDGNNISDNQPLQITLDEGILEQIKNIDTLMILLGENNRGIKITTESLKKIIDEYGTVNIQFENTGENIYNITFADHNGVVIEKLPEAISFLVAAESQLATVLASYMEGNYNWGGQYDGVNGSIEFSTRYSGKYEVLENDISIKDMEELSETQQQAIRFMVSKGYFELQGDLFNPDESLTRYAFAESLVRMFFALDQDMETSFTDVPRDSNYYVSVASAEKDSIIQGYDDDTFRGDMKISKEQVIALCARTLAEKKGYAYPEYPDNYLNFSDQDEIGEWAKADIGLAVREGLINGTGSLNPKEDISRVESVEMLYNLFMLLYETAPAEFVMTEAEDIIQEVDDSEGKVENKSLTLIISIIIGGAVVAGVGFYLKKKQI